MSNNARAAYADGLVPAVKTGVPAALVERFCRYQEWHHTSALYNRTRFYNAAEVRATFGLPGGDGETEANPEAVAALATRKNAGAEVLEGVTVEWIEWGGTMKHPKATERRVEGCRVEIKGQTATVTLPGGAKMTKRLTTRGFRIVGREAA